MRRIQSNARRPLFIIVVALTLLAATYGIGVLAQGSGNQTASYVSTFSGQERAERFHAGNPWQGRGQRGISQQEAEAFPDYPLFWLGDQFAGYNLQSIIHEKYPASEGAPVVYAGDSVTFIYGTCAIPDGAKACPVPLVVRMQPGCSILPETVADSVKGAPQSIVRGNAQVQRFRDGHVRLWTGRVSIFVGAATDPALVDQMVAGLSGLNTGAQPGEPLAAPNLSGCAPPDLTRAI